MEIEKKAPPGLLMSQSEGRLKRMVSFLGEAMLFIVASLSVFAVLFIFYFIVRDAWPFVTQGNLGEFFSSSNWYPTHEPPVFGALSILYGSLMITIGSCVIAIPLGVCSAVALSDIIPFSWRQAIKPIIELLASIPSVAYGFFALVVFAPIMQSNGGALLVAGFLLIAVPILGICSILVGEMLADRAGKPNLGMLFSAIPGVVSLAVILLVCSYLKNIQIVSGTNALNVSIILGIMALPTIVSVSEDALQAVGPELRMGSYGLGATRAETLVLTVLPAASSGIMAAIILGIMRALGETMVVWMASGNAALIPEPFYNFLSPVRTMTATIAGEMGETARNTQHYHVLFMTALCLLVFCFICNLISEQVMKRNRMKLRGEI